MRVLSRHKLEQGFTLVEVLTAATLATVGIGATLGVFGASHKASILSQRREVAVEQAQDAMDRLQIMDYTDLALTSTPVHEDNTNDPLNRVTATVPPAPPTLQVKTSSEELVIDPPGPDPLVDPGGQVAVGPTRFTTGSGSSQISGQIYQFVTWRDETCATRDNPDDPDHPIEPCAGVAGDASDDARDTKRLTVAVTLDPSGSIGTRPPIWISSIASDSTAVPPDSDEPDDPDPGSTTQAQTFYLYDTNCIGNSRQTITGHHGVHNTASKGIGDLANDYSTCYSLDKPPDLMGKFPAPGDATTDLYKYSDDPSITGSYPGGLAMTQRDGCPTSYTPANASNTDPSVINQWSVHAWSTSTVTHLTSGTQFTSFNLSGRAVLQLYTQSVGGVTGKGTICATLVKRSTVGGIPTDTVLDTSAGTSAATYTNNNWPTSPTGISFSWDLASAASLTADQRLVLLISVRSDSDNDLVFLYDHPSYRSFLQVATDTPLGQS